MEPVSRVFWNSLQQHRNRFQEWNWYQKWWNWYQKCSEILSGRIEIDFKSGTCIRSTESSVIKIFRKVYNIWKLDFSIETCMDHSFEDRKYKLLTSKVTNEGNLKAELVSKLSRDPWWQLQKCIKYLQTWFRDGNWYQLDRLWSISDDSDQWNDLRWSFVSRSSGKSTTSEN